MIWKKGLFSKCTENIADMEYLYIYSFQLLWLPLTLIFTYKFICRKKMIYEFEFDL